MIFSKLPQLRGLIFLKRLTLSFVKTEKNVYKVKMSYENKNKPKQFGRRVCYAAFLSFQLREKWVAVSTHSFTALSPSSTASSDCLRYLLCIMKSLRK